MSKMRITKSLREYLRASEAVGATVVNHYKNRHVHLTLSVCGVEKDFIITGSQSDIRAIKNHRANVKRWVESVVEGAAR